MKKTTISTVALAALLLASLPLLSRCDSDQGNASRFENSTPISSEEVEFYIDTVFTGAVVPWGMEFLPNGNMLVTDRLGTLFLLDKKHEATEILGLPEIWVKGQGGLLDVELHPNYNDNGWIYISYSKKDPSHKDKGNTAIIRAKLDGNRLIDLEELYYGAPSTSNGVHFGCRLEFDNDGYLFFSIGDRGQQDNAQLLDNSNGKIHRIHDDGRIPADNPYIATAGAITSIYTYGNRNAQGIAKHPATGAIWAHEHGPKGGDEINIIQKGINYGWPAISYGINYDGTIITEHTEKPGMEQPIHYYVPSIAPCGMTFVSSDKYPGWENNILIGSLSFKYLERVVLNGNQVVHTEELLKDIGRVRNVEQSPDGYIYVAVETPGYIFKLIPAK